MLYHNLRPHPDLEINGSFGYSVVEITRLNCFIQLTFVIHAAENTLTIDMISAYHSTVAHTGKQFKFKTKLASIDWQSWVAGIAVQMTSTLGLNHEDKEHVWC